MKIIALKTDFNRDLFPVGHPRAQGGGSGWTEGHQEEAWAWNSHQSGGTGKLPDFLQIKLITTKSREQREGALGPEMIMITRVSISWISHPGTDSAQSCLTQENRQVPTLQRLSEAPSGAVNTLHLLVHIICVFILLAGSYTGFGSVSAW